MRSYDPVMQMIRIVGTMQLTDYLYSEYIHDIGTFTNVSPFLFS